MLPAVASVGTYKGLEKVNGATAHDQFYLAGSMWLVYNYEHILEK